MSHGQDIQYLKTCRVWLIYYIIIMCAQSCLTPCDPMDCIPPGSSVHGILQARILKRFATSFSKGSSWPRDQTHISCVSCIGRWIVYLLTHEGSPCYNNIIIVDEPCPWPFSFCDKKRGFMSLWLKVKRLC